ncbi:MAG: Rrf2 family transcriptional regulator [Clostridia bacterium]|nr:Rrf2 family transcriptional regulator [Clostridia bacterium]
MKISTKGRYALRMMLYIAENSDKLPVALKDVAEQTDISLKYLEQIVSLLSKNGLLKSQRGAQGGYILTRTPDKYSVGDILRATEGDLAPVSCLEGEVNVCPRSQTCTTIDFWKGLDKVISDYVDNTTLADIIEKNQIKQGQYNYYI